MPMLMMRRIRAPRRSRVMRSRASCRFVMQAFMYGDGGVCEIELK